MVTLFMYLILGTHLKGVNMKLKTIFYIYSDATMSAMMAIGFVIELGCALGLYLHDASFLSFLCLMASSGFLVASIGFAFNVYRDIKKSSINYF